MSFQVLVKTTPNMLGSYSYALVSREAAEVFVQRSDVWWWCFPIEEDTLDGGSWHKGGAWAGAGHIADAAGVEAQGPAPAEAYPLPARSDLYPAVADSIPVKAYLANDDEDEDDRW
jgi:hypothetical protein